MSIFPKSANRLVVVFALGSSLQPIASALTLDPVVVIGEHPALMSQTLASVTVIDRNQIESTHANDISELLQGQAGLEIARPGPPGSPISIYIRGGASTHALILLDGIPFYSESATGSSSPIESISLDSIEKIEIIPGGFPSVRGMSAPGGIISITTRSAQAGADTQSYSQTLGSRSTSHTSAFRRWNGDYGRFSVNANRQYTGGFGAINPAKYPAVNPGNNPTMKNTVGMGWSKDVGLDSQMGVQFMQAKTDSSWDNAWADSPRDDWLSRSSATFLGVYFQSQINSAWYAKWEVQRSLTESTTLTNEAVNAWYGSYSTEHNLLSWRNEYRLNPATLLKAGLSQDRNRYTYTYTPLDQTKRRVNSSVGIEQKLGGGLVTLDVAQVGDQNTAYLNRGVGWMFPIQTGWTLMAQHGVTYRLPTIGELLDPGSGGNADLKAERIKNTQLAIQFKQDADLHRLTWFNTIYTNKVAAGQTPVDDPVWAAQGVNKLENINASHNAGIEWSWRHQHQAWSWATSFTVQQPQVDGASTRLKNLSHQFGSLDLSRSFSTGDSIFVKWFSRSSQFNTDPKGNNAFSSGYAVTKLGWNRRLNSELQTQVSIDNLFDHRYESVAGFNAPPRGLFFTLTYQPKP